jgi:ferric-dicitrate binding protein FerR (iron transport regulator)
MTDPTRYAALAARLLRDRPVAKESRLSRDVGISVVAHAVAMRRKRRSARFLALGLGFAAAAAIALAIGVTRRPAPVAHCHGAGCAGTNEHDPSRRGLDAGQSIVAPAGAPTSVVLATGTQIALDAKSVLECRDATATQRFALLRGGAHLHVSKLRQNERFLVDTPQAEVEVRGTVFDVKIEPATPECAARTVVSVHEGRVEVRADGTGVSLLAGEHWSSACSTPAAETASEAPKASSAPAKAPSAPAHLPAVTHVASPTREAGVAAFAPLPNGEPPAVTSVEPSAVRASALSEQNDLYAAAEAARSAGRRTEALTTYARLLALFPHGQLAESAIAARARLLVHGDPTSARAEAERYLALYPMGFARTEMEALVRAP